MSDLYTEVQKELAKKRKAEELEAAQIVINRQKAELGEEAATNTAAGSVLEAASGLVSSLGSNPSTNKKKKKPKNKKKPKHDQYDYDMSDVL